MIYFIKLLITLIIKIIIFDEPDKTLDYNTFYKIIDNLLKFHLFKNITIIIITHNYKIIQDLIPKKIELINNNNNITCINNLL